MMSEGCTFVQDEVHTWGISGLCKQSAVPTMSGVGVMVILVVSKK